MTEPLVFSHGTAGATFDGVALAWFAFDAVMSVRQRWRAGHLTARDPTALVVIVCTGGSVFAAERIGHHGGVLWPGGRLWPVAADIGLAVRIRAQEKQLIEALGAEYQAFATPRKRLIPGVW